MVRRWAELGLPDKPKLHMLMHLSHGTSVFKKGTAHGLSPDNVALSFGFWGFSPPSVDLWFDRIRWFGSPALTATWAEEGLNGNLKEVAAASHAAVFEVRCMREFNATRGARRP